MKPMAEAIGNATDSTQHSAWTATRLNEADGRSHREPIAAPRSRKPPTITPQ